MQVPMLTSLGGGAEASKNFIFEARYTLHGFLDLIQSPRFSEKCIADKKLCFALY